MKEEKLRSEEKEGRGWGRMRRFQEGIYEMEWMGEGRGGGGEGDGSLIISFIFTFFEAFIFPPVFPMAILLF
jgi:hypothetical protein